MLKIWTSNNRSHFNMIKVKVWHEWKFSSTGIKPLQPKWVTTTNTQAYMPDQKTTIANLFLAGTHTKTQAQVWSIEGAVESGRRAAKAIDGRVKVLDQYIPPWISALSRVDDMLYSIKAPQLIDSIGVTMIILTLLYCSLIKAPCGR